MATPKTDNENKKYAAAKSLASSAAGYILMLTASLPLANSIKKINKNPSKYLKQETINSLKAGEKSLKKSSRYNFATQLFKLGLGFLIAVPKSIITCSLIPPVMDKFFNKKSQKDISFTGNKISKGIGKLIDSKPIQKLTEKFHNTNFEMHIMALTDALATGAFIGQTAKSKKIKEDRKKALIYNSIISTGLCIAGGYTINMVTKNSTDKFIEKFKIANKNSPKLEKYIEGIKIVKPALIFGGLYYIAIPLVSTFLADRFDKKAIKDEF